jgi:hypothetical protein
MKIPAAKTHRLIAVTHRSMAAEPNAAAPTIAGRSPYLAVRVEAGKMVSRDPTPMSVATSAAAATEAPRSLALRTMTGMTEPSAIPKRSDGPNAGRAILRKLKACSVTTA